MKSTVTKKRKPMILVIEDDETFAHVYQLRLEHEGLDVRVVGDGKSALEFLEHQIPDLIVLDLILPIMDGFEVLRRIRSHPTWKSLKVIVLTVLAQDSDRKKIEQMGVSGFYVKSLISLQDITKIISELVGEPTRKPRVKKSR